MRICLSFLLLILVSGCSMLVSDAVTHKPQSQQLAQVTLLLAKANEAIERGRFVAPQFDNANGYYRQLLVLSPTNDQALAGIQNLAEILSLKAKQSLEVDRIQDYRVYTSWIRQIAPGSPLLAELKGLDPARQDGGNSWAISSSDLAARNSSARKKIKQAALTAKAYASRVKIIAPTDADGRWIYQQMRVFADDFLFRSSFIIGDKPAIVALDLP
ncbi:MAG: hypothetical protein ACJA0M_002281 [Chitinophagales bacterium]|jgi:hypothetical protein